MERLAFATNPEWWKQLYMDPNANEQGEVILQPGSEQEFKEMAEAWGLQPDEIADIF